MQSKARGSMGAPASSALGKYRNTITHSLFFGLGALVTFFLLGANDAPQPSRQLNSVPMTRFAQGPGSDPPAECAHYEDLITKTVSGEDPPLLSKAQLHWISDELWAAGQGKGVATNFLVFGLGKDSILWRKVNCRGRSVFIENWQDWIDKITSLDPALEVHKVDYNTSVSKANDWFEGGRWSLDVSASVSGDCYDVILVDAPQGYKGKMPGRMQAAQLALDLARRCVSEGKLQRVVVFMHDMERKLEQRIAREVFHNEPQLYFLGTMEGENGDLSAWDFSKNIRPPVSKAS